MLFNSRIWFWMRQSLYLLLRGIIVAITPGFSNGTAAQASGAAYELCFSELATPHAALGGQLSIVAVRLANGEDATGPVAFRVNGSDDIIVVLEAGQDAIIKIQARVRKLEVIGTGGLAIWSPCIC